MKYIHILSLSVVVACGSGGNSADERSTLADVSAIEDDSICLPEIRAYMKANAIVHEPNQDGVKTRLKPLIMSIPGAFGEIGLRIFRPDTVRAVVMAIHGGGWESGNAQVDDKFNDEMASKCNVMVVGIDYHVATLETPFPACINDCKMAAKWLVNNSLREFGTDKLFISGASAGGEMAALTAIYIRDSLKAIDKVKGINLMYGVFDLGRTPSNRMVSDTAYLINKAVIEYLYNDGPFRGWNMEQLRNPQYSPLYANLRDLPSAIFSAGTADPVIDDTYFMEARWKLAGNKTVLAIYPECPHAFNTLPLKVATRANERIFQWISRLCEE